MTMAQKQQQAIICGAYRIIIIIFTMIYKWNRIIGQNA